MNKYKTNNDEKINIQTYQNGIFFSWGTLLKYLIQLIIVLITGAGIYLALKFTYINEKIDFNKTQIEKLDKNKVDWKHYNEGRKTDYEYSIPKHKAVFNRES